MSAGALASIVGLVGSWPGPLSSWIHDLTGTGLADHRVADPGVLVGIRPNLLTFCADSSVNLTQRAESATAAEALPVPRRLQTRRPDVQHLAEAGQSEILDCKPSVARNRSTADDSPMTARPSPSLISSISLSNVGSLKCVPSQRHGDADG